MKPTAALAETSNSKGWWWWRQTLSIDPDSTLIAEPGDTARLYAILSSGWERDQPPTLVGSDWFVLDPEVVEIQGSANATQTVLLRGLKQGTARIVAIHDGLAALAHVSVGEGDPNEEPVPVAAAVSGPQPVLLVGDTVMIRPNLIDEDSTVIATQPSEWSSDFDPSVISVSPSFLVTALAPTPPGATTTLALTHVETELAVEVEIVILPESDPGEWPDSEPAGMTPLVMVDGSTKDWPNFYQVSPWQDDNRAAVVSDPDSKHGSAIEKRFFVGDESGWHGFTYRPTLNGAGFRELFFRMVFRLSPNWQWHSGMNKFFYWGGAGRPRGMGPTEFLLGGRNGVLEFADQSVSGESDSRGNFRVVNAPHITRDVYHTVEILHISNTPGESNGSLRMWINGVEVQGFNHLGHSDRPNVKLENIRWLDYDDTRLTGLLAPMFWGGQHDTKRVNDWIRVSEMYVSGRH